LVVDENDAKHGQPSPPPSGRAPVQDILPRRRRRPGLSRLRQPAASPDLGVAVPVHPLRGDTPISAFLPPDATPVAEHRTADRSRASEEVSRPLLRLPAVPANKGVVLERSLEGRCERRELGLHGEAVDNQVLGPMPGVLVRGEHSDSGPLPEADSLNRSVLDASRDEKLSAWATRGRELEVSSRNCSASNARTTRRIRGRADTAKTKQTSAHVHRRCEGRCGIVVLFSRHCCSVLTFGCP